jgi:hypothetical protein
MKPTLLKLLPYAVGLVLGWLLLHPPEGLGSWRYPIAGALVLLALVAFTAVQILINLPADISLEPDPGAATVPELERLVAEAESFGFERVGSWRVGVAPPARMVAGVHRAERSYVAVYRTDTIPPRTVFDFVSIFSGERGGLTTVAAVEGVALPGAPGSLRQALPGEPLAACWQRHREALAFLSQRGLPPRSVVASSFVADFRESFRRQRAAFLARPLSTTLVTLFRAAFRTSPEVGPLVSRRGIEESAARIREIG